MQQKRELLHYLPELDGVRGIAIFLVLILHFVNPVIGALPPTVSSLVRDGAAGVDVFFVLSGFLITRILLSSRQATNYFSAFYARRVLRIFPLYFAALFLFFDVTVPLSQHFVHKDLWIRPTEQLWYCLFLQNWREALGYNDGAQLTHFWTLAIEEQFYLVWPLALWLLRPRQLRPFIVTVIFVALAWRLLGVSFGLSGTFLERATFTRIDALALGALLASWPAFRNLLARCAWWLLPLCCLLSLPRYQLEVKDVFFDLGSACLVSLAATRSVAWLRSPGLVRLGKYSYGIYVLHYPIQGVLAFFAGRIDPYLFAAASLTCGFALSFAAAWVSWRVLEQPLLRLKSRFPYRFPASAPASL